MVGVPILVGGEDLSTVTEAECEVVPAVLPLLVIARRDHLVTYNALVVFLQTVQDVIHYSLSVTMYILMPAG